MPVILFIGLLFIVLFKRKSAANAPKATPSRVIPLSKKTVYFRDINDSLGTRAETNSSLALHNKVFGTSSVDMMGRSKLTLSSNFNELFEQWKWWIQLPVKDVIPVVENVQYGTGSDLTIPFNVESIERRTEDGHFDISMRCYMDMLSVDDFGNPIEPFKFKMANAYGYVPYPLKKEIDDRIAYIVNKFKDSSQEVRNSAVIDEVRKFYFSIIGKPTHNLYGEVWTRSLESQNWVIRMYQGYLWKLVEQYNLREYFPSRKFPLTQRDNELTSGRNGMPKVDYDGYSNVILDTDTIGKMYVSSYFSSKISMGKNALIAKLFKK